MLSILHRELRVASRRPWTFRIRLWTNVIAFLFAAPMVAFYSGTGQVGAGLFQTLTFLSFWFCLLQGTRLASSSIADEKREGTLGFLFLSDLRPIDIVAGKLFGIFLPMIQPLLAFVPTLSISILLGGITGGEILRAALVLGAVLFYSVSVGLFVSSFSRNSDETGKTTMLLLLVATFLPLLAWGRWGWIELFSAWTAFSGISDPGYRVAGSDFWSSITIVAFTAVAALFAAAYYLPRRWEETKIIEAPKRRRTLAHRFSPSERARILDRNPGEWLAMAHAMSRRELLLLNGLMLMLLIFAVVLEFHFMNGAGAGPLGIGLLLILIRLASQASYPLAEARRSGAVEALLSTPLPPKSLVTGQTRALWRQFGLMLTMNCLGWTTIVLMDSARRQEWFDMAFAIGLYAVYLVALILAVATVGMWKGLSEKSPNSAFFKTILIGLFLPVFFTFCGGPVCSIIVFVIASRKITGPDLKRLLKA